jgi:hypothetical protein
MSVYFQGRTVQGPGFRFEGPYPVLDAALVEGRRVVVIYDYMNFDSGRPARNLFCYDTSGNVLWRAADIGMGPTDAYTKVVETVPLRVGNFAGYLVTLNSTNGDVDSKVFTK